MLFQLACSHCAFLPFSCAPWRCFVCVCFIVLAFLSLVAVASLFYPTQILQGQGSISVRLVLYQILHSLSIFTLSFISFINLCASLNYFHQVTALPPTSFFHYSLAPGSNPNHTFKAGTWLRVFLYLTANHLS